MPASGRFRSLTEGLKILIKISGRYFRSWCNVEYINGTFLVFLGILRILPKGNFTCP
jgi:hypothetical protein